MAGRGADGASWWQVRGVASRKASLASASQPQKLVEVSTVWRLETRGRDPVARQLDGDAAGSEHREGYDFAISSQHLPCTK